MKNTLTLLTLVGTVVLAGCDMKGTSAPAVKKEDAVASVNGQYISKKTLEDLEKDLAQRSGQATNFPKEKLVDELVQREILVQDAIKQKLDQTPEVIAQIDAAKKAILTQASLQNYLKKNPVTDADLKKEYDSKVGGANAVEYKASHILVKTEDEAKKLIAELDKGGKFAKLANKHSLDAKDSQNGGDLGWFSPTQMVQPFSEAVAKLEKGKYTTAPVKTQFGWHIILLEDSRKQAAPPFEAVKEQLKPMLQRQKIQTLMEDLRKSAKVEVLLPKEEPKPVTPPPAAKTEPTPAATPAPAETVKPDAAAPAEPAKPEATPAEPAKPAVEQPKK
ncbi:MAG: peptidylprolyl isomerase [Gammaproteobacteria bacterium]|nr:peptidylprolyl isomerase [Gammaproteobacteria bacterium]